MDVHDAPGGGGAHGMWEPEGYDPTYGGSAASGTDESATTSGSDGSPRSAGPGYEDSGHDTSGDSSGGGDESSGGYGDPSGTDDSGNGSSSPGTMTVEVDGQTRELPAEKDYTGDGRPDAVAETPDGHVIVFADTEDNQTGSVGPDGRADEAYVVDKATGRVIGAAHVDPGSGGWVDGADTDGSSAAGGEDRPGATGQTGGSDEPEVVAVEAGGHQVGMVKTLDANGDDQADSGVIHSDGRAVVLTSTDSDPEAEQAAVVDPETGRVVEVAHVDPRSGAREEGPAPGDGDPGAGADPGTTTTVDSGSGTTGSMTVEIDGRSQDLPAERDYTGDGRPDAATETADGRVIVFADNADNATGADRPDGKADEAYVVDKRTGRVLGATHVDPRTGEWVDGTDDDAGAGPAAGPDPEAGS
jgi:hypothetical protein